MVQRVGERWTLRQGPLKRASLPPLRRREWTLLIQGLDLHLPAARALLDRFRFVPDARLDDLMLSYASDGGGVRPACRFVRRVPVAGPRPPTLADPGACARPSSWPACR